MEIFKHAETSKKKGKRKNAKNKNKMSVNTCALSNDGNNSNHINVRMV